MINLIAEYINKKIDLDEFLSILEDTYNIDSDTALNIAEAIEREANTSDVLKMAEEELNTKKQLNANRLELRKELGLEPIDG